MELVSTILVAIQVGLLISAAIYVFWMARWLIWGKLDAPFLPTPIRYAPAILATLDTRHGDIVYELGSGDGRFMLVCARLAPQARFVGVERNALLHLIALMRMRCAKLDNVEFKRADFFSIDFSQATKMYTYLLDSMMLRLKPKFEQEFTGRLASRAFPIPRRESATVVELTDKVGAHGQHLLFVYDF